MKNYVTNCLVRDLANREPRIRQVLEQLGIDTCCGGGRNLYDAMRESKVSEAQLDRAIETAMKEADEPEDNWVGSSDEDLINCILNIHHKYLHAKLPMLENWFQRSLKAHEPHRNRLLSVYRTFQAIRNDLVPHLKQEEEELFPHLGESRFDEGRQKLISKFETEHTAVGENLRRLKRETRNYEYPDFACATVRLLYDGLGEMDDMLHQHIYLENNVLFPRFL